MRRGETRATLEPGLFRDSRVRGAYRIASNIALNYLLRDADSGVTQKIFDERGANVKGDHIDNVLIARLQVQF